MVVLCWSVLRCALLYVRCSFAILLTRKRELVALLFCLLDVVLLYMSCSFSSQCRGLICRFPDHIPRSRGGKQTDGWYYLTPYAVDSH